MSLFTPTKPIVYTNTLLCYWNNKIWNWKNEILYLKKFANKKERIWKVLTWAIVSCKDGTLKTQIFISNMITLQFFNTQTVYSGTIWNLDGTFQPHEHAQSICFVFDFFPVNDRPLWKKWAKNEKLKNKTKNLIIFSCSHSF